MATNFGTLDFAVSFKPLTAFPLDARGYFENLAEAQKAARSAYEAGSDKSTYYYGQTLTVYNSVTGAVSCYKIVRTDEPNWTNEEYISAYATKESKTVAEVKALIEAGELTIDSIKEVIVFRSECGALVQIDAEITSDKLPKANGTETFGAVKLDVNSGLNLQQGILKIDQSTYDYIDNAAESALDDAKAYTDEQLGALDVATTQDISGKYVSEVTQTDGKITVKYEDLPDSIKEYTGGVTDGVVTDIAVDGTVTKNLITNANVADNAAIAFSKINVAVDGTYDATSNKLATEETVRLAVTKTTHWRGVKSELPVSETPVDVDGESVTVVAEGYEVGDIILVGTIEYIVSEYDANPEHSGILVWQQIGDESAYVGHGEFNALKDRVTEAEGDIDAVELSVADHESRLDAAEDDIDTLLGSVADHDSRLDTAEGDIDTLESSVADHESRLDTAEGDIDALQESVADHDSRLNDIEPRLSTVESDVDTLESTFDEFKQTAESEIDALDGRVSEAENEIDALQNLTLNLGVAITNINNLIGNLPEDSSASTIVEFVLEVADSATNDYRKKDDLKTYAATTNWEISNIKDSSQYTVEFDADSASWVIKRDGNTVGSTISGEYSEGATFIEGTGNNEYFEDGIWSAVKVNTYTEDGDTLAKLSVVDTKITKVSNATVDNVATLTSDGSVGDSGINKSDLVLDVKVNGTSLAKTNNSVNVLIATESAAGVVKSSTVNNKIAVGADGTMEINKVTTDKLVDGTAVLILDCGDSGVTAQTT